MITAGKIRVARDRAGMLACLIGLLIVSVATNATAAPPAQGMLLIANPDMRGTWFARSVILLVQHDEFGSVGLVINRPTNMPPADVLPDVAGLSQFQGKLFIGGPVEGLGVMMLVRSVEAPSEAEHVFDNVYASGSQDLLRDLVQSGESADRVRLYAGYAGWVPDQLDAEIRRGSWTVVAAAEKYVFSSDPGGVWERLVPPAQPIIVRRADGVRRF